MKIRSISHLVVGVLVCFAVAVLVERWLHYIVRRFDFWELLILYHTSLRFPELSLDDAVEFTGRWTILLLIFKFHCWLLWIAGLIAAALDESIATIYRNLITIDHSCRFNHGNGASIVMHLSFSRPLRDFWARTVSESVLWLLDAIAAYFWDQVAFLILLLSRLLIIICALRHCGPELGRRVWLFALLAWDQVIGSIKLNRLLVES